MKSISLFIFSLVFSFNLFAQSDYDKQIEYFATDIIKKLTPQNNKIAVIDFINDDGNITGLTRLISEDLSSELAILSNTKTNLEIVERTNLKSILTDLKLSNSRDESVIAKELGKKAIADVIITGTVTLFGDNYKLNIKILNTENGNIISASKGLISKTTALESQNKKIIKKTNNDISIATNNDVVDVTKNIINESDEQSTTKTKNNGYGWIDFENKTDNNFTVWVSTEQEVQYLKATKFEEVTIAGYANEKLPSLKPGIYYLCVVFSNTKRYSSSCKISKKVEVLSGNGTKVDLQL